MAFEVSLQKSTINYQAHNLFAPQQRPKSFLRGAEIVSAMSNSFKQVVLRRFRDPVRVPRNSNRVPRIRENYHRVPTVRENRVPRIREIGSLQIHNGHLTFSLK